MAVKLSPLFNDAQLDASGNPLSGGKLYTYTAGSTTPQTAYQDSAGATPHANPIILNSRGEPPAPIWLTSGQTYKFDLQTAAAVSIRTIDNVSGVNDTSVSIDQWVSGPAPTYISATSFSLAGDQTSTFQVGRRVKTTNSGGTIYSTIKSSVFGAVTTIIVANDSGTLDSGLSAVSYGLLSASNPSTPAATSNAQPVCNGRLTLTSGTPVTTADVTAATSVYFTPFGGNTVDLYDGSANWVRYTFSELTLSVPATTATMYDVFLQNNAGTLQLNAVAWTNDTTRATALVLQNGVYVKSGATSQRYLGSFRTTGVSGKTEDSLAKRYVWNYYNRLGRAMRVVDTTDSWTYTTAAYRQANNSAANQLDFVIGVSENPVNARVNAAATNTGVVVAGVGIGLDSTTVNSAQIMGPPAIGTSAAFYATMVAEYRGFPDVGRHTLAWLENSSASGTTTWYGDAADARTQSGITGEVIG